MLNKPFTNSFKGREATFIILILRDALMVSKTLESLLAEQDFTV